MNARVRSLSFSRMGLAFERGGEGSSSIVSPVVDFFFVGGITFLILPFFFFFGDDVPEDVALMTFSLAFIVNYPHFMHSYQLLYEGFTDKLRDSAAPWQRKARLWFSGVIAPVLLIVFLAHSALSQDQVMLGYAVNMMFFLVGWHYAKQSFGILISLSVRKKVFYSGFEKNVLLANVYICWISFWAMANAQIEASLYKGIPYETIGLPEPVGIAMLLACIFSTLLTCGILFDKYKKSGQVSINGMVAYFCGIYMWLAVVKAHPVFLYIFPALHSLQYLLFVWKMRYEKEKDQLSDSGRQAVRIEEQASRQLANFIAIGVLTGALSFYLVPTLFDYAVVYDTAKLGPKVFLFCFLIFLNVHHYFIDFAIWRRDNPDMKYLFR